MALRCRPGDLAVVVEGEGIGAFVDVLRRSPDHPKTGQPSWECRCKADTPCCLVDMVTGRLVRRNVVKAGGIAMFVDAILQPIRPPPVPMTLPPRELETN